MTQTVPLDGLTLSPRQFQKLEKVIKSLLELQSNFVPKL